MDNVIALAYWVVTLDSVPLWAGMARSSNDATWKSGAGAVVAQAKRSGAQVVRSQGAIVGAINYVIARVTPRGEIMELEVVSII